MHTVIKGAKTRMDKSLEALEMILLKSAVEKQLQPYWME